MRSFIIVIWLAVAALFLYTPVTAYISGQPESKAEAVILKESEAENIEITAVEEHGIRSVYAFRAGDDFGVAVFSHFAGKYDYEEGMMSNGDEHIDVNLDAGWDTYQYRVTADGVRQTGFQRFGGIYRMYAAAAAVMLIFSIAAGVYSTAAKKRRVDRKRRTAEWTDAVR